MASAGEDTQLERLLTVYRRVEEVLYGSVYPLRADASDATGEIPLGKWESPFVVSKQLGRYEVIFGSVLHHMHEAARPILRIQSRQEELVKSLPSDIRSSMVESYSGNEVTLSPPAMKFPPWFLYQQDEIIKDAILLSAPPVRTLMEIFSGKGNGTVPTYDYEGNPSGGVLMQRLFHALSHHRYCVVSGGYISDIFSGEDTPGLPDVLGTKVKANDLFNLVISFLGGITINDFVGMLRGRLERLSIDSKPKDMIFAHQNVYGLTEVVRDRIEDACFSPFRNYLFSQFTEDENREIDTARRCKSTVELKRRFNLPRFTMGTDLDAKVIAMSITINDKQERFEFGQKEFFEKLTATCGNESLIPVERLTQRIENLSKAG